jgi:hypothetical protein
MRHGNTMPHHIPITCSLLHTKKTAQQVILLRKCRLSCWKQLTTVGLTLAGRYRYEIYGQNSAVNTNPSDASVVGIVERGYFVLQDNSTWYDVPTDTIPNDIIYEP